MQHIIKLIKGYLWWQFLCEPVYIVVVSGRISARFHTRLKQFILDIYNGGARGFTNADQLSVNVKII